jgi:hypothetical protein
MKLLPQFLLSLAFLVVCGSPAAQAQIGPQKGGHELELWTGGGHATNGVTAGTGVWNIGGRYGWVLTDTHGPGALRGKFEYAVDLVPVFWIFEPQGTAYGFAINPVGLKWNFSRHGRLVPYMDLDSGALLTNKRTPAGTSRVNFTNSGAVGVHILGSKFDWSGEIRFMHISNGSISPINPGINTVQLRLGVGLFTRGFRN